MSHSTETGPFPHRTLVAEAVLPGHPDKLSDQVADAVVDIALARDERAIVQVEVAVDRDRCWVNGRCSTAGGALDRDYVEATIRAVYGRAGFGEPFPEVGDGQDYQCPRGADVRLELAAVIDEADPDERAEREHTDDQAIHIGYAVACPESRFLPLEQHLALHLRDRLTQLCATRRELGAGPDGKVVVTLAPDGQAALGGAHYRVRDVIVSLQHLERASLVQLERAVSALVREGLTLQAAPGALGGRLAPPDERTTVRFNRSGVFVAGGPMNDNGQTGRKLVCDFYGPRVPIGGGALSGKDPWRLDRVGAFRTRQLALAIVETGFVEQAQVTFAWAPRDRRPSHVEILADGRALDAATAAKWLRKYDPSLAAAWEELELAKVNYENCARFGHFGREVPWEQAGVAAGAA
ncbi:MAG TPA: methionine adenosyltransferase domain-containing protein [Gemmatimonadaceae bacterium]|nr:methionine adenosyltransferase domain-containing protein [Gemmatimonadaceae bacterium]